MEIIKWFKNINKKDVSLAGGKGASLGEMLNAGIPVPNGFVVLSDAFEQFIKETDLDVEIDATLDKVNIEEIHTVENASETIQSLILSQKMPLDVGKKIEQEFKKLNTEFVAVRSSATSEDSASAAWAGQLDTFLNTTKETLLENVKRCWASLFTPRAIFYRFEKKLHRTEISVAVVVQKMVESEISGIAFSVHPVTQDRNQLIIEAGFGLGEAIVSGQITPDSYVVDKRDWKIIDVNVNSQTKGLFRAKNGGNEWKELGEKGKEQVLSSEEIVELSKLIVKIEKHYGFPCDIEWAREGGKFYIVQSRPITTLTQKVEKKENIEVRVILDEIKKLKWEKLFTRPFSVQRQEGPILQAAKLGMKNILIIPSEKQGVYHWYFVASQINELGKNVEKLFLDKNKFDEHVLAHRVGTQKILSMFSRDVDSKTTKELGVIYKKFMEIFKGDFSIVYAIPFGLDGYVVPKIKQMLEKELGKNIEDKWKVIEQQTELLEIQKIQIEVSKLKLEKKLESEMPILLNKYGWLTIYDFYDKPANAEFIQSIILGKTDKEIKEKIREFNKEIKEHKKNFGGVLDSIKQSKLKQALRALNFYIIFRSERMDNLRKILVAIKPFYQKLTNMLKERNKGWVFDDIVNLTEKEIEQLLLEGKTPDLKSVKSRSTLESCHYYDEGEYYSIYELDREIKEILDKDFSFVSEMRGNSAVKGQVRGIVKIIHNIGDLKKIEEGDILITSMTKPDYVAAMKRAGAIVTDEGGITCHAAITARELKKPCIIATKIATKVLKDGDLVEVDADNGVVRILKKSS